MRRSSWSLTVAILSLACFGEIGPSTTTDAPWAAQTLPATVLSLSERVAEPYASERDTGLDVALSAAAEGLSPRSRRAVWDAVIRDRGIVFDEMAARSRVAALGVDPETARLAEPRSRLGALEISNALPYGSAVVSYVRYERYERPGKRRAAGAAHGTSKSTPAYLAFVALAGQRDPALVSLGNASEIERLVSEWRIEMRRGASLGKLSSASVLAERRLRSVGGPLRAKIWDPVARQLTGARRVFVVPDGILHLVNLAALPIDTKRYLLDQEPLVHYVATERDIVKQEDSRTGSGLLALADPAFDDLPSSGASPANREARTTLRGAVSTCASFRSLRFTPLSETAEEAVEIAEIWSKRSPAVPPSRVLTGSAATEAAFKRQAPSSRLLHIATHDFFLGSQCASENPLLRSGLALAGANRRGEARPEDEDGVLTAEEIAAMDLSGVEWVVLSACDTGHGELQAGEDVFGLRRAFQLAGARSVITSLWVVDGASTRQWMRALYDARLARHMDTAESVREAGRWVLQHRRHQRETTHPFFWGGFVASGDWR